MKRYLLFGCQGNLKGWHTYYSSFRTFDQAKNTARIFMDSGAWEWCQIVDGNTGELIAENQY